MPRHLRSLLSRLLLLAVCFHAAVGMAVDQARHLGPRAAAVLEAPADAGAPADSGTPAEDGHGACAWCVAFAAQLVDAGAPPALPAPAQALRLRHAAEATDFAARPRRWAFAARDPPAAQR